MRYEINEKGRTVSAVRPFSFIILLPGRDSGPGHAAALPLRSSLPGIALVHLFSSKMGSPLTMIQR
jgi:hypothetical protein